LNFEYSYSAIITCFNAEQTISTAIDSILNQSITPSEIIIVDDYSKDESVNEISKFLYSNNIFLHSNTTNLGVAASRNIGVRLSSYDNIIFFDDDDFSSPKRALEHLRHLNYNSTLSYVSSEKIYSSYYSKSFLNKSYFGCLVSRKLLRHLNGLRDSSINNLYLPASTLGFKKSLWVELKGFDETFHRLEDIDFAFRASIIDSWFSFSDKVLVTRYHSKGSDKSSNLDQLYLTKFLDKHKGLLDLNDYNQIQHWLKLRSSYFEGEVVNLLNIAVKYFFSYPREISRILLGVKRLIHDFIIITTAK
jgi:glycosyltransferase involved in cell wall biosynthesis